MKQTTLPYVVSSDTSKSAAKNKAAKAVSDNEKILELFQAVGSSGLTDREIESTLKLRQSTASARRRGLVLAGLVKDSGNYRTTPSGNKATVWVLSGEAPRTTAPKQAKRPSPRLRPGATEVWNADLRTLFFCSIRYSIGRQTSMPGLIQDLVRLHKHALSADDLRQLANEITTEYAWNNGKLGSDSDTKKWIAFSDWLLEEAKCR
jgi:hypothetical protein